MKYDGGAMAVFEDTATAALFLVLLGIFVLTARYNPGFKASRWYDIGSTVVIVNPPRWLWAFLYFTADVFMLASMYVYIPARFDVGEANSVTDTAIISAGIVACLRQYWYRSFFKSRTVAWAFAVQLLLIFFLLIILGIMGSNGLWTAFGLMIVTTTWHLFVACLNACWIWAIRSRPELFGAYSTEYLTERLLREQEQYQEQIQKQQQRQPGGGGVGGGGHIGVDMTGTSSGNKNFIPGSTVKRQGSKPHGK